VWVVRAVVAEKPSVARDIAHALGARARGEGRIEGSGWIVTWSIGHLVALAEPHEIDPAWRAWRRDRLPMLPASWRLVVLPKTREQFEIVRAIITAPEVEEIVCATDAGREGELIFRYIYEAAGCTKPIRRLWISSLTPDAIRAGFANLKDGAAYDPLAAAARGRSRADWLVGMNLSRAYTIARNEMLPVGRVQTPTLAIVVDREKEIRAFVPEDYFEVSAVFVPELAEPPAPGVPSSYRGAWFAAGEGEFDRRKRLPADGEEANRIVARVRERGVGAIESVEEKTQRFAPPPLYDLSELQRHANRLYGFSAQRTLDAAQRLYERHKLLSYPRTDCRHLSGTVAATLAEVIRVIAPRYPGLVAAAAGVRPLGRRFVDDTKVSDHHAIIPTATDPARLSLDADEARIYDLVARRLLEAWHEDHVTATTQIVTAVASGDVVDRFHTSGTRTLEPGWKVLDPPHPNAKTSKDELKQDPQLPPLLERGQSAKIDEVAAERKTTRPPKRLTEAALLTAMETAGKTLDDKALSRAMQERGLGTPATRAAIIEGLLARELIEREGRALAATEKGIALIDCVHPHVKSPAMTGEWEAKLRAIERAELGLEVFMRDIEAYVREVVGEALDRSRAPRLTLSGAEARAPSPTPAREDASIATVVTAHRSPDPADLLRTVFRHEAFRPHQEEVVGALIEGSHALLVMPTGAGKSLCYQLPGLARAGTTIVISPLIALMEDQVAKLNALGLRAERIHSGRARTEARAVCREYLRGSLDYLFIAPERLAVPGFPEMLGKRRPALIAIDEAHCISYWGHDFRPDYRMLKKRLPSIGPAPVIALTATATPRVQRDIIEQLALEKVRRFVHGFRRTNLAIEIAEVSKPDRVAVALDLVRRRDLLPAILYAPTRREADAVAASVSAIAPAAAYHAGMSAGARDRVQKSFLAGDVDVIVATIAFGMGIDKANVRTIVHLALPQSLEAYYQEIGRAGRDGLPARVLLLHSYADRRQHEFFHERDYPEPRVMRALQGCLSKRPIARDTLLKESGLEEQEFEHALEKLWIHGGAEISPEEMVVQGHDRWERPYLAQREHHREQVEMMARFAQSHGCRMLSIVRHFGDSTDSGEPCGLCDACAQSSCLVRRARKPSKAEIDALERILDELRERGEQAGGPLHRAACESRGIDRRGFDVLLSGLSRAGLITVHEDRFEKDGRKIAFQRIALTARGQSVDRDQLAEAPLPAPADEGKPRSAKARSRKRSKRAGSGATTATADPEIREALRSWRLAEARREKVPAFRVMSNRVLETIAAAKPADGAALLRVKGVGPATIEKYGGAILSILQNGALT
jgi:DNA topoisomerase III